MSDDKYEIPPSRRLPFDASGKLLPDGPEFPTEHKAPDLEGLPWDRRPNREWTTEEQRRWVLSAIVEWMKTYQPWLRSWKVIERDNTPRSSLRSLSPTLEFQFTRTDGSMIGIGASFEHAVRKSEALFKLKLEDIREALAAQI